LALTVAGVLIALFSTALLASPRQVWRASYGWRYANPEGIRLSDTYVIWLRLSGAVGVALGTGLPTYALR